MGTPRACAIFRFLSSLHLAFALVAGGLGCSAAQIPGHGARPWPTNAVDREIRRLSEQAVAETLARPGSARCARTKALAARLGALPREESPGYRLDRALLAAHLERELAPTTETPDTSPEKVDAPPRRPEGETHRAKLILAELEAAGFTEVRGLTPSDSATTAVSAVFLALAERLRPGLPLTPARAAFEAPGFRAAWVALGPHVLFDLGLRSEVAPPPARGGLAAAYLKLRAVQGPRFRPWDVHRLLLGLGSDDRRLVFAALAAMGLEGLGSGD